MNTQLNLLRLVYPPISNQEGEWLKDDKEVQEVLRKSNLYMICQRAELKFSFQEESMQRDFDAGRIPFCIVGSGGSLDGYFDMEQIRRGVDECEINAGDKLFRVLDATRGDRSNILDWFTPDKALFDRWRNNPRVGGLDEFRKFTRWDLHYVGISKDDSLRRLLLKPHDKRLRVLSNEHPKSIGSRVTDEILLLFFAADPLLIKTLDEKDLELGVLRPGEMDGVRAALDAERAYVSVLKCEYNDVQFVGYPDYKDGLASVGFDSFAHLVAEPITLVTSAAELRGDRLVKGHFPTDCDWIGVKGGKVTVARSSAPGSTGAAGSGS